MARLARLPLRLWWREALAGLGCLAALAAFLFGHSLTRGQARVDVTVATFHQLPGKETPGFEPFVEVEVHAPDGATSIAVVEARRVLRCRAGDRVTLVSRGNFLGWQRSKDLAPGGCVLA